MVDAAKVDRKFENACSYALHEFGLYHFKEQQRLAMKELILGRDVFVILPTGSGKSLIFQAFPLVLDYIEGNHGRHQSIVVVISPLLSLMKDQVNYLQSKGVKAAYLGEGQEDETVKDGVEKGEYQIVYGSPETFLATIRWRKMLSSTVYRQNLRLIAVDEAHCISHWGFSLKKGERAFRIWFRRINELRSLVGRVPLLALTATATKETRNKITKTLEMDNAVLFSAIPDRKNIAYAVQVTGSDPQTTFQALINTLKEKRQTCDRVIIYCPRIKTVAALYGIFKGELGEDMYVNRDCNPQERQVEMYHARIDEQNKDTILKSFSDENGCIRVLIATIAYGMGIDCKGVKNVIHYGPPQNLERYLQESGRAGRSADLSCRAVILYSNVMLQQCDEGMVNYIRNKNSICRRKLLLAHFDVDLSEMEHYSNPHQCCDVCKQKCNCDGDSCGFVFFDNVLPQDSSKSTIERCVTTNQMQKLTDTLRYLRTSFNNYFMKMAMESHVPLLTSVDLLSGFGDSQISQVMEHASKIFSLASVYQFVDIWHPDVAIEILFVLNLVFGDIDHDFEDHDMQQDSLCSVPDFDLWSSESDDNDAMFVPSFFFTAEDMYGYPEEEESS